MKYESLRKTLGLLARNRIPEDTNLWPRLAARLERKGSFMQSKWKFAWIVLLVLLGLFAVTSAAYAVYHYFNDVGLQSASDAGLVVTVNATALPTHMPTATPPEPVTAIGDSQTLESVNLTLEWIYLMDGQQAFGLSATGLEGGKTLGMPVMGFGQLVPEQYRGAGLAVKDNTQSVSGTYVVNQIVRDAATFGISETRTDVSITIPLLDANGQVLNKFRFAVKNELVHEGPFVGGNTYSTRANGLDMSLDWILLSSKSIQARLCFVPPDGKDWTITAPSIQLAADIAQLGSAPETRASRMSIVTTETGVRCQIATFPVGAAGAQAFILKTSELTTPPGETLKGDWEFNWNQLPGRMQFPGIPPLEAPLEAKDIGNNTTVMLEKSYADVNRMVYVVFIKSSQEGLVVSSATLKDSAGTELNTGLGISSQPDDPTRFIVELYPDGQFVPGPFKGELSVQIGTQFGPSSGLAEAHFAVDLTVYPAVTLDPMQTVTVNGVEMLVQRVKVTPSYTQVYLCYQKPSSADWTIGSTATLQVGADTANPGAYALLFDPEMGGNLNMSEPDWTPPITAGRCVKLGFPVGHHGQSESMTLTIPQLEQSTPEVIPADQLQAARKKLLDQGIEMDWVTSSGNGGGGAGPVISKKPDGMTDEQVMRLFFETLGYDHPGPWIFTLKINP